MKIKIIHIISGLNNGGTEMMLLKLIKNMDKDIFDNKVLSLKGEGYMSKKFSENNIEVLKTGNLQKIRNIFQLIIILKRFKKYKPDIIQTWLYHGDFFGVFLSIFLNNRNLIWNIRQSNISLRMNKLSTVLLIYLNSLFSKIVPKLIIYNSIKSLKVHNKIGFSSKKAKIIPNGFDTNFFKPNAENKNKIREILNINLKAKLIGFIGRFDPQKNHEGFIKAALLVKKKLPDTIFLMAGDGVDSNNLYLRNLLEKNSLKDNFLLLGIRNDINSIISSLDLSVCFSLGEGFPNILGESMSCGIPCIVSDVGDCKKILNEPEWVVNSGDFNLLAHKIIKMLSLNDFQRYSLGVKLRDRIKNNYSINKITKEYESMYKNLISKE